MAQTKKQESKEVVINLDTFAIPIAIIIAGVIIALGIFFANKNTSKATNTNTDIPEGATPHQVAAAAVESDFQRLRAWCNDEWYWVGVIITDVVSGEEDSLWGIESDSGDYLETIAHEIAAQIHPLAARDEAADIDLATD